MTVSITEALSALNKKFPERAPHSITLFSDSSGHINDTNFKEIREYNFTSKKELETILKRVLDQKENIVL